MLVILAVASVKLRARVRARRHVLWEIKSAKIKIFKFANKFIFFGIAKESFLSNKKSKRIKSK